MGTSSKADAQSPLVAVIVCAIAAATTVSAAGTNYPGSRQTDSRSISGINSFEIYGPVRGSQLGYSDQPQLAFSSKDPAEWYCVLTRGTQKEGQNLEWVQGYRSYDFGLSWKLDAPIRKSNPFGPPSAWVNVLQSPGTSRLYATYTYNVDNVTQVPGYKGEYRNDMWGVYMVTASDDLGKTWSSPATIPPVLRAIDRSNVFNGSTLCGWSVGKPIIAPGGRVLQQFTKRYSGTQKPAGLPYVPMEQFLLASNDLLGGGHDDSMSSSMSSNIPDEHDTTSDVARTPQARPPPSATWETLPLGQHGINATAGELAEEGDVVLMPPPGPGRPNHATRTNQTANDDGNESQHWLAYIYRTYSGFLNAAFSLDGTRGAEWTAPYTLAYARQFHDNAQSPFFRALKNPNGPTSPRSFAASDVIGSSTAQRLASKLGQDMPGWFVIVPYYANGDNDSPHRYLWRNPYWLACGYVPRSTSDGSAAGPTILWGEPAVLAYDPDATKHGIGYPDLVLRNNTAVSGQPAPQWDSASAPSLASGAADSSTEFLFAETNKLYARLHKWNAAKLFFGTTGEEAGLCTQPLLSSQPEEGLVAHVRGPRNGSAVHLKQPAFPSAFTSVGQGLTIDVSVSVANESKDLPMEIILLECNGGMEHGLDASRPAQATGSTFGWLRAEIRWASAFAGQICINSSVILSGNETSSGDERLSIISGCSDVVPAIGGQLHASVVLDGASRVLHFVANGALSDGGNKSTTGFVELPANATRLGPAPADVQTGGTQRSLPGQSGEHGAPPVPMCTSGKTHGSDPRRVGLLADSSPILTELFIYDKALSVPQLVSAHQSRGLPSTGW